LFEYKEVDPEDLVHPGHLYKSHQATADAKAPAIVMVHGGLVAAVETNGPRSTFECGVRRQRLRFRIA
jgi:hypothetical protein